MFRCTLQVDCLPVRRKLKQNGDAASVQRSERDGFRDVQGRIVLLRRIAVVCSAPSLGPLQFWRRDAGGLRGQRTCDEADGAIAVGHAPRAGRKDLRLSELLNCAVRDLVRPARRNRRSLYSPKSADAFRVMPSDAKHRQLPLRPPLHRATHGLRLCVALARITESNRACPKRRAPQAPFATTGCAR
jgi:hypothetical protein